ncbi:hypothetical protein [Arcicella rigui]|uniref:Uncharacterized protein n=1 Tax=Arcicella rigui TaxID=797020 RepID=A0ABU5Q983_9BACT|nr:hypothetical protein [Arcicella rigui]MEA5139147.1 hypothetical protein [Arcicella rigui]
MSIQNRISAVLPEADKTAALASLEEVKTHLPFLISTPTDQGPKRTMGPASVEYVSLCLEGAKKYPDKLTRDFDAPEFERDVNLIGQLWSIRIAVADLLARIDDTMNAASADAMVSSDKVYDLLKRAAKEDGAIQELVSRIGLRYKAQSKPKKKPKTE